MFELIKYSKCSGKRISFFTTKEKGIAYLEKRGYSRDKGIVVADGLAYFISPGNFYYLSPIDTHPIDPE